MIISWYIPTLYQYISYFGIVLFTVFLLYDSQILVTKSQVISKYCNGTNNCLLVNYPSQSLSIFLDLLNLYTLIQGN